MSEERSIDGPRIERAVRELLLAIGEDPGREGLIGTPERVAEAYAHLFLGLDKDPASYLEISFASDSHDVVLLWDLPLASMCEHHLLPFVGKTHVAYVPEERVVGLSGKFPRKRESTAADAMRLRLEAICRITYLYRCESH